MKRLLAFFLILGLAFGADLKSVIKLPGVAALKGSFQSCNVEILMNEAVLAIVWDLPKSSVPINNSILLTPKQLGYFIANLNLYMRKLEAGAIPDEGSVANLGNSYCTIVVQNNGRVFKSSTGVYWNLLNDKMLEFFIPESKYTDKDGDYAGTEQIWGLMLSKASVVKIIESFKAIADQNKQQSGI